MQIRDKEKWDSTKKNGIQDPLALQAWSIQKHLGMNIDPWPHT
jgi:hypothetical protein